MQRIPMALAEADYEVPVTATITGARPRMDQSERSELVSRIKTLLRQRDAVLVAHYYVDEIGRAHV